MPLRIVMLAHRYWPLVGPREQELANLARGVRELGVAVTLLTPRYQPDWPERLDDRGVRVLRLPHPPRGFWSRVAWRRQLGAWLREERSTYDLVHVSRLGPEAVAAWESGRQTLRPVVIQTREPGELPRAFYQLRARRALREAACVIADGPDLCAALVARGCARENICEIPAGVPLAAARSPRLRLTARRELAGADPLLQFDERAPLALCVAKLRATSGFDRLLAAWRIVVEQLPAARLWIVGEGAERQRLERALQAPALAGRVALVAPFDTLDSFYQAADLFVLPGEAPSVPYALREAMAAGLPCVVCAGHAARFVVEPGLQGLVAEGQSSHSLAAAMLELLADPARASRFGAAARRRAETMFPLAQVAQRHVDLWTEVISRR